jgi:hypothetical protein
MAHTIVLKKICVNADRRRDQPGTFWLGCDQIAAVGLVNARRRQAAIARISARRRCSVLSIASCRSAHHHLQLCKSKRPRADTTIARCNPHAQRAKIALHGLQVGAVRRIERSLSSRLCGASRISRITAASRQFMRES